MLFIFQIKWLSGGIVKALCWTFIHSLWQGLVAAIIAGAIIISTRKTKASLRYNLLVILFAVLLLGIGGTFFVQLPHFGAATDNALPVNTNPGNIVSLPFTTSAFTAYRNEAFINTFNTYCNEHAGSFILLWLVFFMAKCMKTFSGLYYINRLKKCQVYPPPEQWRQVTKRLSRALGIHQPVVLLESRRVNVPVTIGFLKATILIPIGLLANLPPEQVEAVLLHKLAHIRRKDYLVNLLQTFAETILFFNPAVCWMSALIRQEREACCDDMVLAHLPHKKPYLEALVCFQEHLLAHPAHAMALASRKYYLLHRIKRMLTQENQKLNIMEKTVLVLGVMVVTAFGFVRKQSAVITSPTVNHVARVAAVKPFTQPLAASATLLQQEMKKHVQVLPEKDTVPDKENVIRHNKNFSIVSSHTHDDRKTKTYTIEVTDSEGNKYLLRKVNDIRTEFKVNGRKAPEEKYAGIIDQMEEIAAGQSQGAAWIAARSKEQLKKQELLLKSQEDLLKQQEKKYAETEGRYDQERQELLFKSQEDALKQQEKKYAETEIMRDQRRQELLLKNQEDVLKAQEKKFFEAGDLQYQKKQELLLKTQEDLLKQQEKRYAEAEGMRDQKMQEALLKNQEALLKEQEKRYFEMEKMQDQKRRLQEAQLRRLEEALQKQQAAFEKQQSTVKELQEVMTALKQEMVKDGLIQADGNYELIINSSEMLINGKKQPAAVHQKYLQLINNKRKNALGNKEEWKINLSASNSTSSVSIIRR